ncbi:phage holin family protein [Nocardioides lentus]|uniref:Phage holin family protein n=1 Tax=Nocardioides lentus TaxID=338077 RepID=A0ABP5AP75_9ACTN
MLRSFAVSFLALTVALWALPGTQVTRGAESVAALAVGVLALGALLRPFLTRLTVLTGVFGLLLAGVLAQALVLWLALELVPTVQPFSVLEVVVVSWGAAVAAAGVNWLVDASSDEAFLGQLLRRAARSTRTPGSEGTGLLVVQLDGVSEPLLRQAVTSGAMPTLSRWLRSGDHRLRGWHTGVPSTTPAGQAVLLHGEVAAVPSFRWWDKEAGRMLVCNRPADAAEVERGFTDGRGLLADGGVSVSNLFSGDAPTCHLTMSRARLPGSEPGMARFATARTGFLRSLTLFAGQMLTEIHQGRRQRRRDVVPRVRRGGTFVLLRGLTTVVLRDLNVSVVAEQMTRGAPVVYVDFVDYDEVAHHAGPSRPESMRTLESLDRVLAFFEEVASRVGRRYEIAVVSDHGQAQGPTFAQVVGRTLTEVVQELAVRSTSATSDVRPVEPWGPATLLLESGRGHGRLMSRAARTVASGSGGVPRLATPAATETDPASLVVAASGCLAHVYLTDLPGRLDRDAVEGACPGLVRSLAEHPGVGVVLTRDAAGVLRVDGPHGWRVLTPGEEPAGAGADPLAPYAGDPAADLRELETKHHVGDLVLLGRCDPSLDEVVAFEELVGSHGGLGGWQTSAFVVHPTGWPLPLGRALTGLEVHRAMVARLEQHGLRRTDPGGGTGETGGTGDDRDERSARLPA